MLNGTREGKCPQGDSFPFDAWVLFYRMKMRIARALAFLLWVQISAPHVSWSQACCSAGTPLLSSLELPSTSAGTLQLALTYEYNTLRDVLSGSSTLNDDSRRRTTHSLLLETSYGFTSFLTASVLLTVVQQERSIRSSFDGGESFLQTRGVGDAIVLLKYDLIRANIINQLDVSIGAGAKIPLGRSNLTTDGILLPADMQPGTGAWDGILWGYVSQGFVPTLPLNVFASASYRYTGSNARYGSNQEGYTFANELVANLGVGFRTDTELDFSLVIRFRQTTSDRFAGSDIPNTGGRWLSAVPGINIKVLDNLAVRASGQIPVYRNLDGTQLTTSYTASVTVFYNLSIFSENVQ
jgi:hypothetical protein